MVIIQDQYMMYYGGLDYEDFIEVACKKLYDHINPYPGPHSVIIIDNATIHHVEEWRDFIDDTGIVCIYLGRYCPWMNLIEWMFNAIKRYEEKKQIKGEYESIVSLCHSAEQQKGKNWIKVLRKLGYCK